MIVSDRFEFVYIAIPRTASKSMCQFLREHYGGRDVDGYHDCTVRNEHQGYLIFTVVRNPYGRALSRYFKLKAQPELDYLTHEGTMVAPMTQCDYVYTAGVELCLRFEDLPECVKLLPFVGNNPPPFPHLPEFIRRPKGTFHDLFTPEDEAYIWERQQSDFLNFGYKRQRIVDG